MSDWEDPKWEHSVHRTGGPSAANRRLPWHHPGQPEDEDRRRADRKHVCFVSIFCMPVVAEATGGIIMHVVHDGSSVHGTVVFHL